MNYSIAIAVQDPQRVSEALVKIWQGHCIPFPFLPNSYVVMPQDPTHTAVEIFPADTELVLAETEETTVQFYEMLASRAVTPHEPIPVPATLAQIKQVAKACGWPVYVDLRRLSGKVQIWIEDRVMLELLPTAFVQSTWVASPSIRRLTLSQANCPH
jgi:hypothetical protein